MSHCVTHMHTAMLHLSRMYVTWMRHVTNALVSCKCTSHLARVWHERVMRDMNDSCVTWRSTLMARRPSIEWFDSHSKRATVSHLIISSSEPFRICGTWMSLYVMSCRRGKGSVAPGDSERVWICTGARWHSIAGMVFVRFVATHRIILIEFKFIVPEL